MNNPVVEMTRPRFSHSTRAQVAAKTNGRCFHCNKALSDGWHVDHHPIPFRDIENNICCCALTDPEAIDNLQPSCPSCNTSHKFEPAGAPRYCGHTQLFCSRRAAAAAAGVVFYGASMAAAYTLGGWQL